MKKFMTLAFAAMIALTLSMPAWSQTPKPATAQDKKEDKKEVKKEATKAVKATTKATKKTSRKKTDKAQFERFVETARQIGVDEDPQALDRAFDRVTPRTNKKSKT